MVNHGNDYNMAYPNRGKAVIINNRTFKGGEVRDGSEVDVTAMRDALTRLDFQVDVYENCTAREMIDIMTRYGRMDHTNNACFVGVIMSHGDDSNRVLGVDNQRASLDDLQDPITRAQSLREKPKIFFIQACRGELRMDHIRRNNDYKTDNANNEFVVDGLTPRLADVFILYSTVQSYVSFRHPQRGSLFIQSVVTVLNEHGNEYEIHDIGREVNKNLVAIAPNEYRQVSNISSTLRFRLVFIRRQPPQVQGEHHGDNRNRRENLRLTNDAPYEGQTRNGRPHGSGIMTWARGDRYDGDWENGERHGGGTLTWASGDRYNGDWVNNERHGGGTMTWANGDKYTGDWERDQCHGGGTMTWAIGDRYEGDWENDQRHGGGTMTWANGDRYEGDWENDQRHGGGNMRWANGSHFNGDWINDRPIRR